MRRTRTPAPLPATERPADPAADTPVVAQIRDASRALVRDWGFMGGRFAGTDLSPSAVHALIEVEGGGLSARDLGQRLRLEKSSVSRMLAKLVAADLVAEQPVPGDARLKQLSLTAAGRQRVQAIHAHARDQVLGALGRLRPDEVETVCRGLSLYAGALGSEPTPAAPPAPAAVQVLRGYRSGVIAHITRMHAEYYAREVGFGQRFESVVAAGLASFCDRLDRPVNGLWTAVRDGEVIGSVALDGEDLGPGIAHLRWFMVGDGARGAGVGRRLLAEALALADAQGCRETRLWTVAGLSAARHLYEAHGFVLAEEWEGTQWGPVMREQRFVRPRP